MSPLPVLSTVAHYQNGDELERAAHRMSATSHEMRYDEQQRNEL